MEDRLKVVENIQNNPEESPVYYFAIFDGHAGFRAAEICQNQFHDTILQQGDIHRGDLKKILADALKAQDKYIIDKGMEENWTEGSCASVVLIRDKILYSANLGDSHMVLAHRNNLSYKMTPIRISETHKATEESEKKRILSEGGMVMKGRVFGDLSISRALGDLNYKIPKVENDFVSSDAFTTEIQLTPENLFVIIASDGLWDKISFQEAVDMVHAQILKMTPQELSKMLLTVAQERGSGDNISVIVVMLIWEAETEVPIVKDIKKEDSESEDKIVSTPPLCRVGKTVSMKQVHFRRDFIDD